MSLEQIHTLEDQAVFSLTELMRLYLKKRDYKAQDMFRAPGGKDCWSLSEMAARDELAVGISPSALHVLEHPVPAALRHGMEIIADAIFKHTGSTELMSKVLYRVADNFPGDEGKVGSILDKTFDGIGGWLA
jgi:hypothetical protein